MKLNIYELLKKQLKLETYVFIAILVIMAVIPPFIPSALIYLLGLTFLFIILATSWDLTTGYTGQLNLGHTVFVGIGAYTAALLQVPERLAGTPLEFIASMPKIPIWIDMLIGGILAGIFGLVIGIITLRLKGWYFALVTAILPLVFVEITLVFREVLGGEEGFSIGFENALAPTTIEKYYLSLILMAISVIILQIIINSKLGLRFMAIRDDIDLAESIGIDTTIYKVISFAISSFFAGVAGAAIVHYRLIACPDLFDIPLMLLIILSVVIGGQGTLIGPVIGAIIVYLLKHWWLKALVPMLTYLYIPINDDIILYMILIILAILFPEGIWMKLKDLYKSVIVTKIVAKRT